MGTICHKESGKAREGLNSAKAHANLLQRSCSDCPKKRKLLQRRAVRQSGPVAVPPIVHEVLRSPGRPLDAATRGFMESRFSHEFSQVKPQAAPQAASLTIGPANDSYEQEADRAADSVMQSPPSQKASADPQYDFSQVRVHGDARAAESARAVNARAYTVGRNIVFGSGMYAPGTTSGQRLIAHELAHTIQQSAEALADDPRPNLKRFNSRPFQEQVAGESEGRSKAGRPMHLLKDNATANRIQRQSGDDKCKERGPAAAEDHPLIYSCQEVHNLGCSESERCKRPAVGYSQKLLNAFLERYDEKTITCIGNQDDQNRIQALRNSLSSTRLKVDCWFGSETDKVTRMFQRCKGLNKIDGKIGEETWPRLEEDAGVKPGGGGNVPPITQPLIPYGTVYFDRNGKYVLANKGVMVKCSTTDAAANPTPSGRYCIRHKGETQRENHKEWFLLEPQFDTTRNRMHLHLGHYSLGCVTVIDPTCYELLAGILENGTTWKGYGHDGCPPGSSKADNSDCKEDQPKKVVDCVGWLEVAY